jgi:predicted PurR-regulated permease PerM
MICILLFSTILTFVLLAMQVHAESIELINIGKNIINDNVYSQPYLKQMLPEKDYFNSILQTEIDKFYIYGRDFISLRLETLIETKEQQAMVEQQILTQWDNLYSYLSQNATTLTSNSNNNTGLSNTTFRSMFMNKNLFGIIESNIGILLSVVDSVYIILKSNLNVLYTVLQLTISVLFQSGFAVFNFIIQLIVYLTVLFYLLSTSKHVYKPLKWLNEIAVFRNKDILSRTIEDSISSVFVATFKMAFFYGFYTFLIHDAFSLDIAYTPSIIASVFACLPIINTYWVGLPGLLKLWLIDDKPFVAFAFFFALTFPTYFVDMAIYSEIKVSHPYLTGLAIAGGLLCLGLEGAVIGPIVLCLFIVIIRFNKTFLLS